MIEVNPGSFCLTFGVHFRKAPNLPYNDGILYVSEK